ncbi:MAG: CHRD domain-containing protein [Thermoproteota archaeon]|nr:CHRD domain-containing protein [Thermoproteota archaeon]
MSNFHSKITTATLIASVIAAVSTIPIATYAQQQTNFSADLSGKNIVPPVNTSATGTAKFNLNPNGTLSYEVDGMNLNQVIGAHVTLKNGTVLAELLNLYATTGGGNKQQSAYPSGPINGKLVSDVITAAKLDGPLFGKNVTDLINYMKSGSVFVTIRTTPHQQGEIRGQILPSNAPTTTTAAAPGSTSNATTAAAPGMNKTAGMTAPTTTAAAPGSMSNATTVLSVQRQCVSNILDSPTMPAAHQQLIDKIVACFNQK